MNLSTLYHQFTHKYIGFNNTPSFCNIYWIENAHSVCILMLERNDNPGTAVTNRSENIANELCKMIPEHKNVMWFEKYQNKEYIAEVIYMGKRNAYHTPRWISVSLETKKYFEQHFPELIPT